MRQLQTVYSASITYLESRMEYGMDINKLRNLTGNLQNIIRKGELQHPETRRKRAGGLIAFRKEGNKTIPQTTPKNPNTDQYDATIV